MKELGQKACPWRRRSTPFSSFFFPTFLIILLDFLYLTRNPRLFVFICSLFIIIVVVFVTNTHTHTHTLTLSLLHTHTHKLSLTHTHTHTQFFLSPFCFDTISYLPLSCVPLIFSWLSHFFGFRRVTIFYFYCPRFVVTFQNDIVYDVCSFRFLFSNDLFLLSVSLFFVLRVDDFNSCCHIHFYDAAVNEVYVALVIGFVEICVHSI